MAIRSLRGAITVAKNDGPAILSATTELLETLIERNRISGECVISAIFSATADLDQAYPAEAARKIGWTRAGLLCLQEMPVKDSLPMCLRVLILWETDRPQSEMRHCFLRGAVSLRPDIAG